MEDNIYKTPESELEVESAIDTGTLASRSSRLGASLIDALTIIPISITLMYFTGGFDGLAEGAQPSLGYTIVISLITSAIFLVVHGSILVRDGQTWGKKALNIKITTLAGEHASVSTLAKRYGFYWCVPLIPVIGILLNMINILFIFSTSRRCVHDYVGGTKVIIANN